MTATLPSPSKDRDALTRRRFSRLLGAAAGTALASPALAQGPANVVVIGGGAAGASVAKLIKRDAPGVRVTLITADPVYTTCFFSNLFLAGFRSLQSISFGYDRLQRDHGVNVVVGRVVAIDRAAQAVQLQDRSVIRYDRLALAPGIAFRDDAIQGYDAAAAERMPHAWQAGFQAFLLKRRLETMKRGGLFVLAAPTGSYRCPPGPYERASMAALLFKRVNPRAKVLIVDAKDSFPKQEMFEEVWAETYGKRLEWTPGALTGGGVARVDAATGEIELGDGQRLMADAACIIPPQRAADIVVQSDLVDQTGWAPVDANTMRSRLDEKIFVLGDSSAMTPMPKSAFAANSQARIAAQGVINSLELGPLFPARFRNTCWSFVAWQQAVKIGATYATTPDGQVEGVTSFASTTGESRKERLASALEANGWYAGITSEMFA